MFQFLKQSLSTEYKLKLQRNATMVTRVDCNFCLKKKFPLSRLSQDIEQLELLCITEMNIKSYNLFGKCLQCILLNWTVQFLDTPKTCMRILIADVFMIALNWECHECPWTRDWIKKLLYFSYIIIQHKENNHVHKKILVTPTKY